MKLISFDVGIKNMAYCIFDVSGAVFNIDQWNVLNLMDEIQTTQLCSCPLSRKIPKKKTKVENLVVKMCQKKAKFEKNGVYYCEKHTKNTDFLMPSKQCSQTSLKKMKIEELLEVCQTYGVFSPEVGKISFTPCVPIVIPTTKKGVLEKMEQFFDKKCFHVLNPPKKKTANDTDLISIGKNINKLLNEIPDIKILTHVVIENQISPIANRMKTIQGMLAQYFIMTCSPEIVIEFISSANKLKEFVSESSQKDGGYKQHKKDGVVYCKQILEKYPILLPWTSALDTTKKDDLADSFLQGIWYMKKNQMI